MAMGSGLRSVRSVVFACVVVLASPVSAVSQVLDEVGFRSLVVGVELTGMLGTKLTFFEEGTIVGGFSGEGALRGSWRFEGDLLCTTVQDVGVPPMSNCGVPRLEGRRLVVDGENGWRLRYIR